MWSNQPYNFDNLGTAMVSLFVTATLNGYEGRQHRAGLVGVARLNIVPG